MKYVLFLIQFFVAINALCNNTDSLFVALQQADNEKKLSIYEELCIAYYSIDLDSAAIFAESKLKVAKKLKGVEQITISLKLLGNVQYFKGEYDLAINYYNEALEIAKEEELTEIMASIINNIGNIYIEKGEYDNALKSCMKVLEIDSANNNLSGIGSTLTNIGNIYLHQSQYSKAIDYYKKALAIALEANDTQRIISAYNNLGLAFHWISNFEKTSEYYFLSLKKAEEIEDVNSILFVLLNLGSLYYEWGYTDKSLDFYDKVKTLSNEINSTPSLVRSVESIGIIYNDKNKPDSAIAMFQFALGKSKKMDNPKITSSIYLNLGYSYELKKDFLKAKKYYHESFTLSEQYESADDIANALSSLGRVLFLMNRYKKAIEYTTKSNQIAIYPKTKIENYKLLSDIYDKLNMTKKAFENHKLYAKMHDSVFSAEKHQQIQELQTQYETEKKEQQIKNLSKEKKIEILKNHQSQYVIVSLLISIIVIILASIILFRHNKLKAEQKTILLEQRLLRSQMNPHFIFNAISSIQNFVQKNQPNEASLYLSNFAKLMRHILLNSREEFITLEDEVDTLENYLNLQQLRFDNKFEHKITISEAIDEEDLTIPPMIVQPFIENAIQHGISKMTGSDGLIQLNFATENNKLIIEVEDNGIGRAEAEKNKKAGHQSFATDITTDRLKHFGKKYRKNTEIKIVDLIDEKKQAKGTKVIIKLPVKYI